MLSKVGQDFDNLAQRMIGLRIPYFAELLKKMDQAEDKVKQIVVNRSKKCDDCGYCIQTDKTGKRPKIYIPVTYGDQQYNICSLFCGFNYRWRVLEDYKVDEFLCLLTFINSVL
ncbi:MAG TPA: hypothetical protein VN131_04780 [Mobilitalea sp.]|nr:hypothetical protein [Mobilitalea sp.]